MYVSIAAVNQRQLVACNGCGTVGFLPLAEHWRSYDLPEGFGHHCPACVEGNELIRGGLAYNVDPATAVTYV